jgi:hypothetical protein
MLCVLSWDQMVNLLESRHLLRLLLRLLPF